MDVKSKSVQKTGDDCESDDRETFLFLGGDVACKKIAIKDLRKNKDEMVVGFQGWD